MGVIFDGGAGAKVGDLWARAGMARSASDAVERVKAEQLQAAEIARRDRLDQEERDFRDWQKQIRERELGMREAALNQDMAAGALGMENARLGMDINRSKLDWMKQDRDIEAEARALAKAGGDTDRAILIRQIQQLGPEAADAIEGLDLTNASPDVLAITFEALSEQAATRRQAESVLGRIDRMYSTGCFGVPQQQPAPGGAAPAGQSQAPPAGQAEQMREAMAARLLAGDSPAKVQADLLQIEEKFMEAQAAAALRATSADAMMTQAAQLQGKSPGAFARATVAIEAYRAGEDGWEFEDAWKEVGEAISEANNPMKQMARQYGLPYQVVQKTLEAVAGNWINLAQGQKALQDAAALANGPAMDAGTGEAGSTSNGKAAKEAKPKPVTGAPTSSTRYDRLWGGTQYQTKPAAKQFKAVTIDEPAVASAAGRIETSDAATAAPQAVNIAAQLIEQAGGDRNDKAAVRALARRILDATGYWSE